MQAISSYFGAVGFRYSTSILAHYLSQCKGTTFCWILFDIPCLLAAMSFLDILSETRKEGQEEIYTKSIILEEVQSAACQIYICQKTSTTKIRINNVCNRLSD